MKLKGKQTIDVEISVDDLVEAIKEKYYQIPGVKQFGCKDYINKDGYWMMYDGDDYHTGIPDYIKGQKATKEELQTNEEMKAFFNVLEKIKAQQS